MKTFRKPPASVSGVKEICRCPPSHPRELHNKYGCTSEVVIFNCARVGHDHRNENCIQTTRCRCRVAFGGLEIGKAIQEAEKTA